MNKDIINAAILYRDALKENQAELLVPIEECRFFYVPQMPHSHRSVWIEANLVVFYRTPSSEDIDGDYLKASDLPDGTRRGLYFYILDDVDDLDYCITEIACNNLRQSYSRSLRPHYVEVDFKTIVKLPKLLAFS